MKKTFNSLILLFFVFFWIFFSMVLQFDKAKPEEFSYDYRFTFISPFANAGYWGNTAYGMLQADKQLHTNTKFTGFLESDAVSMGQAIRSELYARPDGLITAGSSEPAVVNALKEASRARTPVILIDNDNPDTDRLCYIGPNNYEMGRAAGREMTLGISEPLYAAVLIGSSSSENQSQRLKGFEDQLSLHPDCRVEAVMEANYSLLTIREMLPALLKDHPKINAIFCAEGYSSIITGEILSDLGPQYDHLRVIVSGHTAEILDHIASGRYHCTITQDCGVMGQMAVEILKNHKEGVPPKEDTIYLENIIISKENLDTISPYESEGVTWHLYNGNLLLTPQSEN